ncbi:KRAB-A domain-containing protein 2-like [Mercenaria mercenaria]|uniref:KRAB-A domain-containing protein 2-like n=1 Tax=Mercenaria mercenaria TaxID=6596 RepID=UPI00234EB0A9|nr:KRAB-A domain-containing protein 2-like [Mercenaria mercenaria]
MAQAQIGMSNEQKFTINLFKNIEKNNKSVVWPRPKYDEVVAKLLTGKKTCASDYYHSQKFDVLQCGDIQRLVKKKKQESDPVLYYVCAEDMYSIIQKAHIITGHGGRDKMLKELAKKYANITRDVIGLFKELCEECQLKKRKLASKGLVIKPILSKDFNSRGQVDLVDMQSLKQGEYKFIMHYQDHLTKFSVLRALTSKRAAEVAFQLLDIFLLISAPNILQSDNGREFTASVISELKDLWPDSCIVHGKPRHPQTQGSVERANADIKDMLVAWMRENQSKSWTIGLKFVQFMKNNSYHSGIKRSPYKAMFGCDAKMGLTTSSLPNDILSSLESEEDLQAQLDESQPESCTSSQTESECEGETELHTTDDEAQIEIHAENELVCAVCSYTKAGLSLSSPSIKNPSF